MELLSPAGSIEQALAGIKAGCNAIYGGLKKWNARNRAQNFSIDEYKEVMGYCKSNNVKFYMTINTLLRDREIDEIVSVFTDENFILPDAVILSDMGLAKVLKEEIPHLELHASTQYGTHNLNDIEYLSEYGISRVILAREVSLKDVIELRKNSSLEIEVFIWGSQCIGFSGMCYLGGLSVGGSGNRGRCIGLCRDIYDYKGEMGQYFYPEDLNALSKISVLKKSGINSIKIEGRMRKPQEIFEIVSNCRRIIDTLDENISKQDDDSCGYLGEELPVKGLVNKVNSRNKINFVEKEKLSTFDKIIKVDEDNNKSFIRFEDLDKYDEKVGYYKTCYTNDVVMNKKNIGFKIFVDKRNKLTKIDFINQYGERKMYEFDQNSSDHKSTVQELYNYFNGRLKDYDYNIYEFVFQKLSNNEIKFNKQKIDRCLEDIQSFAKNNVSLINESMQDKNHLENQLTIEAESSEIIDLIIQSEVKDIIYSISSYDELLKVLSKYGEEDKITYKLPLFDWNSKETKKYLDVLNGQNIMVTRLSQLYLLKDTPYKSIQAYYTVNCWNKSTLDILKKYGVSKLIGSPELSFNENMELVRNSGIKLILIFAGNIPLLFTRHCFKDILLCHKECNETKYFKNFYKGLNFNMYCNQSYRELFFDKPFLVNINETDDSCTKDISFCYVSRHDSKDKVLNTIKIMLENHNYYRELINDKYWNNSWNKNYKESVK